MSDAPAYDPGPARAVEVNLQDEKAALTMTRELASPPAAVWRALTDAAELRQWAPYDIAGNLGAVGTVKLTWVGSPQALETRVTRAEPPRLLEFGDLRWELEPAGAGTRLRLIHRVDRRFAAMGAAGWHICLDVLERLLAGSPIGRKVGADAMGCPGWQRLHGEYARQLGIETPSW